MGSEGKANIEVFFTEGELGELHAFLKGASFEAYRVLGCRRLPSGEFRFAVYAPNAQSVYLVGDFNGWGGEKMEYLPEFGLWCMIRGAWPGQRYKYAVRGCDGHTALKSDPFSFRNELRPANASVVWDFDLCGAPTGGGLLSPDAPVSIYEVHIHNLRRKLKAAAGKEYISAVWGIGFMLTEAS